MAIYADLTIDRGSYFETTIGVNDTNGAVKNLTGYSGRGKIRKSYNSSFIVQFTVRIPNPSNGQLVISLSSTETLALKSGRYVYDVEIYRTAPSQVIRVLEGQVDVTPSVTQGGTGLDETFTIVEPILGLGDLADVDRSGAVNGSVLIYDSSIQKFIVKDTTSLSSDITTNSVKIPTGKAVYDYVASKSPVITLGGDLSGSVTLTGLASGTLNATVVFPQDLDSQSSPTFTTLNIGSLGLYDVQYGSVISGAGNVTIQSTSSGPNNNITIGSGSSSTVYIAANLVVQGTTTTVNTNSVTIEDPIFSLGSYAVDNFDRGIAFKYRENSLNREGFFGWDRSENVFTFLIPNGQDDHLDGIMSGTTGTVVLGNARFANLSGNNTGDQTITLTGDVTGSGTGTFATSLSTTGVTAGTYRSVTVDTKGRITGGTNPTTLSGYGITDAQPIDSDLTAIAQLTTTGIIRRTGAGTATAGTTVSIAEGGTGSTTAASALSALGGAPLASPALTGTPTAPTAAVNTDTTQIATTAYAKKEADDAQAYAIQRINHTGSQAISTITGLQSSLDGKVNNGGGVSEIRVLTQDAYNALTPKISTTLYIIVG